MSCYPHFLLGTHYLVLYLIYTIAWSVYDTCIPVHMIVYIINMHAYNCVYVYNYIYKLYICMHTIVYITICMHIILCIYLCSMLIYPQGSLSRGPVLLLRQWVHQWWAVSEFDKRGGRLEGGERSYVTELTLSLLIDSDRVNTVIPYREWQS